MRTSINVSFAGLHSEQMAVLFFLTTLRGPLKGCEFLRWTIVARKGSDVITLLDLAGCDRLPELLSRVEEAHITVEGYETVARSVSSATIRILWSLIRRLWFNNELSKMHKAPGKEPIVCHSALRTVDHAQHTPPHRWLGWL